MVKNNKDEATLLDDNADQLDSGSEDELTYSKNDSLGNNETKEDSESFKMWT